MCMCREIIQKIREQQKAQFANKKKIMFGEKVGQMPRFEQGLHQMNLDRNDQHAQVTDTYDPFYKVQVGKVLSYLCAIEHW